MNDELYHHGIKGMKWGVRRYQNKDGSYKPAGKKRYSLAKRIARKVAARKVAKKERKQIKKRIKEIDKAQRKRAVDTDINKLSDNELRILNDRIRNENTYKDSIRYKKRNGTNAAVNVLKNNGDKIIDKLVYAGMIGAGALAVGSMFGEDKARVFKQIFESKKKSK